MLSVGRALPKACVFPKRQSRPRWRARHRMKGRIAVTFLTHGGKPAIDNASAGIARRSAKPHYIGEGWHTAPRRQQNTNNKKPQTREDERRSKGPGSEYESSQAPAKAEGTTARRNDRYATANNRAHATDRRAKGPTSDADGLWRGSRLVRYTSAVSGRTLPC